MDNDIGDEGARAIADALNENNTVTKLWLEKNGIQDEGARALADALKEDTKVPLLDLSNNNIGAEGARALANALKENSTLEILNLSYNSIGDEGAKALADALGENITLEDLELNCNKIGDEGARALADALNENTTLRGMEMRMYEMSGGGSDDEDDKNVLLTNKISDVMYQPIYELLSRNEFKGLEWKIAVIAKAEAQKRLTEEEEKVWEAEKEERQRKSEEEDEKKQNFIKEGRKQFEAELKKKAKEEAEEAKRAVVDVIAPKDCKIMVSFNDRSAGEDAELLTKFLTKNGHPTFCTRLYCPKMAGSWREVTTKGVRSCKYYIMLLTKGWQESDECQFETKIAINRWAKKKVTLIPVWYKDFDFDYDEAGDGYDDQFGAIQSVKRERSTWMKIILEQLGGSNAKISFDNYGNEPENNEHEENGHEEHGNDEREENGHEEHGTDERKKIANDEHGPIPKPSTNSSILQRREFWTHAGVIIAVATASFAIGSSRRKS